MQLKIQQKMLESLSSYLLSFDDGSSLWHTHILTILLIQQTQKLF